MTSARRYLIEILDTAGQDEYQIFHMRYAMGIHGYILMCDAAAAAARAVPAA